jgi:hypothetical protein
MAEESPALFIAEGQPREVEVLLLAEELGPGATKGGQADLTLPFRVPSHISIGEPIVCAVEPTWDAIIGIEATSEHAYGGSSSFNFPAERGLTQPANKSKLDSKADCVWRGRSSRGEDLDGCGSG